MLAAREGRRAAVEELLHQPSERDQIVFFESYDCCTGARRNPLTCGTNHGNLKMRSDQMLAAREGRRAAVEELLRGDADPFAQDMNGFTPVHPTHYTLLSTSHTLHPAPCALHPAPCTLHPAPCALRPASCTLHPAFCALHPTPYTLHPTPCTLHPSPWMHALKTCPGYRPRYPSTLRPPV